MFIVQLLAMDELDEGPHVTLGPYETWDAAQEAGDTFLQYMLDEYPDHEWDAIVEQVLTYEEAMIQEAEAKQGN